jgi:hypothetical protein
VSLAPFRRARSRYRRPCPEGSRGARAPDDGVEWPASSNTSFAFIHTHSQFSDYFLSDLDFYPSRTILLRSRSDGRGDRDRHERGAGCDGPVATVGPFAQQRPMRCALRSIRVTSAVEGGRPKDPANAEDRVSVKARYAVGCWKLQAEKPSRAERRRETASVEFFLSGRVFRHTTPRARRIAQRSAHPLGGRKARRDRRTPSRTERGAMTHVCSPDGAQRNPGSCRELSPRISLRSIRATKI